MTTALHLRARLARDLEQLADLWAASWQEAMPQIDFMARRAWFCDHLLKIEQAGSKTVCAVDGAGLLLGFVSVDPATAYLDQLAVAARVKGRGIAQALLDEAKRLSPGGLGLDVNQDNPRAVRFYLRQGFAIDAAGENPASGLKTWRLQFTG